MSMEIREFRDGDRARLDAMQFALQKYFSEVDSSGETRAYESMGAAHRYMEKMLDDVRKMRGKLLVAVVDGEIVGFTQGVIIEHKEGEDAIYDLTHAAAKEGWIGLLFVEVEFRGQGIGRGLLDKMKEHFKENNCSCVKLLVLAENKNAIEIYKKSGFVGREIEMRMEI